MHVRTRGTRLLALVMAGSLLAAACGDDDDGDEAADLTETTVSTEPVVEEETVEPASGEPITIGFVNMEDGPLAQPTIGAAAEAARQMINANGGINGRPLEFEKCVTNGAPDSSGQCANQLVAAGVPVAYQGLDFGNAALHPILADAGIPLLDEEVPAAELNHDQVRALLARHGEPLVLGADLNDTPDAVAPLLRDAGLLDALDGDQVVTWPMNELTFGEAWRSMVGHAPQFSLEPRRLDYLLSRGLEVAEAGVEELQPDGGPHASDHAMVWARYTVG